MTGRAGTRSTPFESACPLKPDPRTVHILDRFLVLVDGKMCRYLHSYGYVIVTKQRTSGRQTVAQVSFLAPLDWNSSRPLFVSLFTRFLSSSLLNHALPPSPHPLPIQSTSNVSSGKVEVFRGGYLVQWSGTSAACRMELLFIVKLRH